MSLLDQVVALLRWKRMIILNTVVVAVASVIVALLLPKIYRSTASLFPPEEESLNMGSLSSLVSIAAFGTGRSYLPVWASPSDVYAAILRSREVREAIVERFDLIERFEVPDTDRALKVLEQMVEVNVGGVGLVHVSVEHKNPELAADMANAFVEELDRVNREKRMTSAGQARVFIEARLRETEQDLAQSEDRLRILQESTGVVAPEQQVRALVQAGTDLEVELVMKEVELGIVEAQLGPDHPDREALARQVRTLREKLTEIDQGRAGANGGGEPANRFEIPLERYPSLSLEYFRALRDVKVQETIYELLRRQYEQFRIQESRDTRTVHVLDSARPSTIKVRPKRSILCITATLSAFILSLFLAAGLEAIARVKRNSPETYAKLRRIAGEMRMAGLLDRL